MADQHQEVKGLSRRIAAWFDCHPRTGWYVAVWVALVSLNALVGYIDLLLHALS